MQKALLSLNFSFFHFKFLLDIRLRWLPKEPSDKDNVAPTDAGRCRFSIKYLRSIFPNLFPSRELRYNFGFRRNWFFSKLGNLWNRHLRFFSRRRISRKASSLMIPSPLKELWLEFLMHSRCQTLRLLSLMKFLPWPANVLFRFNTGPNAGLFFVYCRLLSIFDKYGTEKV